MSYTCARCHNVDRDGMYYQTNKGFICRECGMALKFHEKGAPLFKEQPGGQMVAIQTSNQAMQSSSDSPFGEQSNGVSNPFGEQSNDVSSVFGEQSNGSQPSMGNQGSGNFFSGDGSNISFDSSTGNGNPFSNQDGNQGGITDPFSQSNSTPFGQVKPIDMQSDAPVNPVSNPFSQTSRQAQINSMNAEVNKGSDKSVIPMVETDRDKPKKKMSILPVIIAVVIVILIVVVAFVILGGKTSGNENIPVDTDVGDFSSVETEATRLTLPEEDEDITLTPPETEIVTDVSDETTEETTTETAPLTAESIDLRISAKIAETPAGSNGSYIVSIDNTYESPVTKIYLAADATDIFGNVIPDFDTDSFLICLTSDGSVGTSTALCDITSIYTDEPVFNITFNIFYIEFEDGFKLGQEQYEPGMFLASCSV